MDHSVKDSLAEGVRYRTEKRDRGIRCGNDDCSGNEDQRADNKIGELICS
jgi:hypothetical protein